MAKPFVSVLIDTYNHERFIEQAIASVLQQDFPATEREIIVVDDGSTDGTAEIVRRFEPQLRLLRKKNGGQASAFNAGIPECRGEIVAFLDGDDWWAPEKLSAVSAALSAEPEVGLVGHGITEVYLDGRQHMELLRETPRFRITNKQGAEAFRLRKSFLGTSRMTFRAGILRQIGRVPEALTFEADEYLFTLAGLFSDVLILRESLTFYRLHEANAFQTFSNNPDAVRRKQHILATLAKALDEKLREQALPKEIAQMIVGWVQTEADLLRLKTDGGFPWETVRVELQNYRMAHKNVSPLYWFLKCLTLLPACFLPARSYYSAQQQVTSSNLYRKARSRWFPFSQPEHVDRFRTMGS